MPLKKMKRRTPKHGQPTLKCGPGTNCKNASKAACSVIAAIRPSEMTVAQRQVLADCQSKAVHPTLLNP